MPTTSISQRAGDARALMQQSNVGVAQTGPNMDRQMAINSAPQLPQQSTLVVNTYTDATTYTFSFNGVEYSYLSVTADTDAAGVAAKLLTMISAEPAIMGVVTVSRSSATITFVERGPFGGFTLTDSDSRMTTADTVASAAATAIPFGRLCFLRAFLADSPAEAAQLCALPDDAYFTAQVDNFALTYGVGVLWTVTIEIAGERYPATITQATDAAASVALMVTQLNAVLPANSVLASASTSTLVLTAEKPGEEFFASSQFGTSPGSSAAVKTSNLSALTSLKRAGFGIAERVYSESGDEYPANSSVTLVRRGGIDVALSATPTRGGLVYVETGPTLTGALYDSNGATRIPVPDAFWDRSLGDGIARLHLN